VLAPHSKNADGLAGRRLFYRRDAAGIRVARRALIEAL
jgi:hypothetical protein